MSLTNLVGISAIALLSSCHQEQPISSQYQSTDVRVYSNRVEIYQTTRKVMPIELPEPADTNNMTGGRTHVPWEIESTSRKLFQDSKKEDTR